MITCKTKFGTLYARKWGSGYQLLDSEAVEIQYYDNDMPVRWLQDNCFKGCKDEQDFFDTLYELLGGHEDLGIYYGKNINKLVDEMYDEINDYNERNGYDKTTKNEIKEVILNNHNTIGKYYVLVDYWQYF